MSSLFLFAFLPALILTSPSVSLDHGSTPGHLQRPQECVAGGLQSEGKRDFRYATAPLKVCNLA